MSQQAQASNRLGLGVKQTPVTQQGPALAAPPGVRDWKGDLSELGISDCTWVKVTPDFISREAPAERIPCDLCLRAEHGGGGPSCPEQCVRLGRGNFTRNCLSFPPAACRRSVALGECFAWFHIYSRFLS